MEIIIRDIEGKDYLALLSLLNDEIGSRDVTVDGIAHHHSRVNDDERYKTLVALVDDEVVGFISSVQFFSLGLDSNLLWIVGIAVKNKLQNKGIGTKLLQYIKIMQEKKAMTA